jgi:hypothetical protein
MTREWCPGCRQYPPLEAFAVPSGVAGRCRSCRGQYVRQWRERNPEAVAAYNEARRLGPRERKCIECSIVFLAGKRGPAATRCINCRRARKLEQRRELRRKVAVT